MFPNTSFQIVIFTFPKCSHAHFVSLEHPKFGISVNTCSKLTLLHTSTHEGSKQKEKELKNSILHLTIHSKETCILILHSSIFTAI